MISLQTREVMERYVGWPPVAAGVVVAGEAAGSILVAHEVSTGVVGVRKGASLALSHTHIDMICIDNKRNVSPLVFEPPGRG